MSRSTIKMTKGWKIVNSLWVLLPLFPLGLLAYLGFFYIGIKTRRWKWINQGFIYLVIIFTSFLIVNTVDDDHLLNDIFVWVLIFAWFSSFFHSLAIRQQYLNIVFRRKLENEYELQASFDRQELEFEPETTQTVHSHSVIEKRPTNKQAPLEPRVININKATELEISSLPTVHPFLAKNIIQAREEVKQFNSIEHVAEVLQIKLHVLDKSKRYIAFSDEDRNRLNHKLEPNDVKKNDRQSGRLVDY